MQTSITAYHPGHREQKSLNLFGYATQGIPGIEIVGLGKYGRLIKEKFIFLLRSRKIPMPIKRYVICSEGEDLSKAHEWDELKWLEFPFFILLSQLIGLIRIHHLEECICSGYLDIRGGLVELYPTSKLLERIESENLKLIISKSDDLSFYFPTSEVLSFFPEFRVVDR